MLQADLKKRTEVPRCDNKEDKQTHVFDSGTNPLAEKLLKADIFWCPIQFMTILIILERKLASRLDLSRSQG